MKQENWRKQYSLFGKFDDYGSYYVEIIGRPVKLDLLKGMQVPCICFVTQILFEKYVFFMQVLINTKEIAF